MNPGEAGLLVLAGIGGGLSGSIAGLASLVSYPALLATGLAPVSANVTNTIALVFQGVGNAAGSRPELRGQGELVRRMLFWAVPGGVVGSVLLLITPGGSFEKVVPFLIAGASLAVLIRTGPAGSAADVAADEIPHTTDDVSFSTPKFTPPRALLVGSFFIGIYGGYFGAAAGVMMLALMLSLTPLSLPRSAAVRSVVLTAANLVAALYFAVFGPVEWVSAVPLAVGFLIGGRIGPIIVRHAPAGPLRVLIGLAGLGLAVKLALDAYL